VTHLSSISWIINNKCNLKCLHCYTDSGKEIRPDYSEEEIEALCTSIGTVSPKAIYISGGEPLLDKDVMYYVRGARKIARDVLWICSNGTVITDEVLNMAHREGVNGFSVSLQHSNPEKADIISGGKGVYEKVIDGLTRIKNAGFKLALEMTVLKQNYDIIDDIIQIAVNLKVDVITFKRFRPIGRGKTNYDCLGFSPEEYHKVLHHLFQCSLHQKEMEFVVEDPLFGIEIYEYFKEKPRSDEFQEYHGAYERCGAGIDWVGVDPLGNVSPCPLLRYTGLVIGNITKQPLNEIVETSEDICTLKGAYSHHNACLYSMICRGCRAHAAATGGYTQKDPMCMYAEYQCPIQLAAK